jgi:hypothetical protein
MRPAWCGRKGERELAVLAGAGLKANGGEGLEEQGAAVEGRGVPGPVQEEDSARVGLSGGEGKWARPKEAGHFSIIQTLSNEFELIRLKYGLPVVEKIQIKYVFEYY